MLNMTRVSLDTGDPGSVVLTLQIDLGQSLLSPAGYWQLSQAEPERQLQLLRPILATLAQSVRLRSEAREIAPQLEGYQLPATSLAAIANPLTPQMATFVFRAQLQNANTLSVALSRALEVPWPALVRLDTPNRPLPVSRLLTATDRDTGPMPLSGSSANAVDRALNALVDGLPVLTWVAVGFQHILPRGLDHILFILGLFFLATGARPLLWQVTGFTIAHSVTLALASYGLVQVPAVIVEPLIAASIIYIAVDNLYSDRVGRTRLTMVCLFGLLHGLGFADVLQGLDLPRSHFLGALFAFNIGVELGQLAVLAAAFALVGWFRRNPWYAQAIAQPATLAIAGVGLYWFIHRTII